MPEPSRELKRARIVARGLDSLIPLPGGRSVGLDSILGLVPGIGDLAGAVGSLYIVVLAIRSGASRPAVMLMLWNIAIDTVTGSVPLLGDLFDVGWKANIRNVELMERELGTLGVRRHSSKAVLMVIALGAGIALAGLAYAVSALLSLTVSRLF